MDHGLLFHVLGILAVSAAAIAACQRFGMSPVLGYLATGIVVGPHVFAWLPDTAQTQALAELGVVLLMFTVGLEFSWSRLLAAKRLVLGLGGTQVAVTTLLFGSIAWWLGATPVVALIIGAALACHSLRLWPGGAESGLAAGTGGNRHAGPGPGDPGRVKQAAAAGERVLYGDAMRHENLDAAGIDRARALAITFDDAAAAERITTHIHHRHSHLPILVRSVHGRDDATLLASGAEVFPEGLEASLAFAGQLLVLLGIPSSSVEARLNAIRAEDYAPLRAIFHDCKNPVNRPAIIRNRYALL